MNKENSTDSPRVRLDQFDPHLGLDRGRSKAVEAIWYLFKMVFVLSAFPWPQSLKRFILRVFGANVGEGVVVKPRVNIHFPWKLSIGDHAWIGEECFILNFEPVSIGAHACLSQRSFLCGGNHDFRSQNFEYKNKPITIGAGAWIGAQTFIAPGVDVGTETVVASGSVVTKSLPSNKVCSGNPCQERSIRWKD